MTRGEREAGSGRAAGAGRSGRRTGPGALPGTCPASPRGPAGPWRLRAVAGPGTPLRDAPEASRAPRARSLGRALCLGGRRGRLAGAAPLPDLEGLLRGAGDVDPALAWEACCQPAPDLRFRSQKGRIGESGAGGPRGQSTSESGSLASSAAVGTGDYRAEPSPTGC
uniref:Uncharacterized protein n=1 Tax=Rangifer tarandus platyrhynchus TaxID=3082113 RepID=A0ACB0FDY3_RANTA|nr:unnamed protein product [Rangifer tarandus platyrhynchus]